MKVVILKREGFSRALKLGLALKGAGITTILLLTGRILHSSDLFKEAFDEIRHNPNISSWANDKTVDVFHTFDDGKDAAARLMKATKIPVVYDANDISALYRGPSDEDERYCFEHANGFALKFPPTALDYLRDRGFSIGGKYLEYFDYCAPELCVEPNLENDRRSLCYTGVVDSKRKGDSGINNQHIRWLPRVLEQGYKFHLYPSPWRYDSIAREYTELGKKHTGFTLHRGLNQPALQKEIRDLGYGSLITDWRDAGKEPIFVETAYQHKTSTYFEAGLPIIVTRSMAWAKKVIVDRLNCGVSVTFDNELASLGQKEQEADYEKLRENVLKVRIGDYSTTTNVERLLEFYRSL